MTISSHLNLCPILFIYSEVLADIIHSLVLGPSDASLWSIWIIIYCFITVVPLLFECLCRLQHVRGPFVRGAYYWLSPSVPGHFQSRRVLLSSHLKDNHIENLFAVLHVNRSLSKATGYFSLSWEVSACCWADSPTPSHPSKHAVYIINNF